MAICTVFDNPGQTQEQTEAILAALRASGPLPPSGATHVLGGPHEGGWRMISVWDSPEAMERFYATRLPQAFREVGMDLSRHARSSFPVYKQAVGEGSLAQPA